MSRLSRVLYDKLGREYPRLNLYLKDLSEIQYRIDDTSDSRERSELKKKYSEIVKGRKNHPYIQELEKFKDEEKKFLSSLKDKTQKFASEIKTSDSITSKYEVKNFENKELYDFYNRFRDLDYEARLKADVAAVKNDIYPQIIEMRNRINSEIAEATERGKTITTADIEKAKAEFSKKSARIKEKFNRERGEIRNKEKEGLISKKALLNGVKELRQKMDSELKIEKLKIPDIANKDYINAKKYEIRERNRTFEEILNKDIADIRTKTPVETENMHPFLSFLTLPFPGLGQIITGQWKKGLLLLICTLFIYGIAVPYALGYGNYQGWGVAGLINLAEGGSRQDKSLIFMIEGLVAIALLAISFAIIIFSFKDMRKYEKDRVKGIREKNWFQTKSSIEQEGFPILVNIPALLVTIFMVLIPVSVTILLSFTNMDRDHQSKFQWIGLGNYQTIMTGTGIAGKAFWNILLWTLIWTIVATSLAILVGFTLALLANNKRIKGKSVIRMIYLLPWAVPAFITIMFFSIMTSPNGFISNLWNTVVGWFGQAPVNIKQNTNATRVFLIMMQVWLGSAYVFLLSTGVLQAIPEDLYEAAQIDGATGWQKVTKITLPLVLFQTMPLMIGQYTFNFNNFGAIYLFNAGGPFDTSKYGNLAGSSDLLISYIFKLSLQQNYQALAAAITMLISLVLMLFAYIGFKNSKAFKEERL